MKLLKETLVEEIEVEDFYERIDDTIQTYQGWTDCPSMDINQALDIIKGLKKKGAARIYFFAHTDHNSYIFTGIKYKKV